MKNIGLAFKIIFLIIGLILAIIECSSEFEDDDTLDVFELEMEGQYKYHTAFMDTFKVFVPVVEHSYFNSLSDSTQTKILFLDSAYQAAIMGLNDIYTKRQQAQNISNRTYAAYATNIFQLKELKALPNLIGLNKFKMFVKEKELFLPLKGLDFTTLQTNIEAELNAEQRMYYSNKLENIAEVFPYHPSSMDQMLRLGTQSYLDIPRKKSRFPTRLVECLMLESRYVKQDD